MKNINISCRITDRETDAAHYYFREIETFPLLTAQEEQALAQRIAQGDQRAIDQLVQANLRFVVSIAKHYWGRTLQLLDIIQEGNIGLVQAATQFRPGMGSRFISYAVWAIRNAILQAMATKDCPLTRPKTCLRHAADAADDCENIGHIDSIGNDAHPDTSPIMLDIDDHVATCNALNPSPTHAIDQRELRQTLEHVLAQLSPKQRDIVTSLYGLTGHTPQTPEQLALHYDCGLASIRQSHCRALDTIRRSPQLIARLQDFR